MNGWHLKEQKFVTEMQNMKTRTKESMNHPFQLKQTKLSLCLRLHDLCGIEDRDGNA